MIEYQQSTFFESPKVVAKEIFNLLTKSYGESPWTINTIILDLMQRNRLFIAAFDNDELIGFLSAIVINPEVEITNIAVLPKYRRQGVGEKLLCLLKEDVEIVWLEVRESNTNARKLYQKVDFYETGRRKGYYQQPKEDAILMEWRKNVHFSD
ncbi:MAG: ribosomal protein S18-alanine N-acetyltransferase [Streptococcaceae bacterium]|jgi:ribosomal-protein-alanine N-acetyltransferase|nr:ribosomal protein S18-alanine N-acetyltransferase [Streptococcaceae bacterium]